MELFMSTLGQMVYLFILIALGYILARVGALQDGTEKVIAKLENNLFIPCLVASTFISNFTKEKLASAGSLFGLSSLLILVIVPLAVLIPKTLVKDDYTRNIYTYGLAFSNFGFMGNSVVNALFPQIFMEYLIFTLPLWILIYLWGVPFLLMPKGERAGVLQRLKNFINPMFIGMLIGGIIGILSIKLPESVNSALNTLGGCMSPMAMILTGVTVEKINIKKMLCDYSIYIVSIIRLLIIPIVFMGIFMLFDFDKTFLICAVVSLAMPLGLNTVVIPSAYGKDTSTAAGMALISHALSCATIPLVFLIFDLLFVR